MSDSEHSASDVERKPASPRQRRAPINLDDLDGGDSADDTPRDRKPRVKHRRDSGRRSAHDGDDYDDDDDGDDDRPQKRRDDHNFHDDADDDDEIAPARRPHKPPRRSSGNGSADEYDDDHDDHDADDRRDRKPRVKHEDDGGYDDDDPADYDDDARASGQKRKRVKTEDDVLSKKRRPSAYDDDDPVGDAGDGDAAGYDEEGLDDEHAGGAGRKRPLSAMQRAIEENKALRRPRKKDVDETAVENECIVFLERMMKARDDDLRAYRAGRPPLEKIKMLREVEQMMTKVSHREYLLDNMMLPVFKAWLDRLPDGALPNIDVRTTLLRILSECRVDEDWLQRLEESQGLGKVIHFLSRSDDHEPNRRTAQKLMERWARLVYRSNSNFHDLQDEFDKPEDGHKAGKDSVAAERKAALRNVRNFKTTQERMRAFKHREKTTPTEADMMASIPRATPFLFTTMAEGSYDVDERAAREMRTQKSRTRRVNSTLANLRRRNKSGSARAARPSLNGR